MDSEKSQLPYESGPNGSQAPFTSGQQSAYAAPLQQGVNPTYPATVTQPGYPGAQPGYPGTQQAYQAPLQPQYGYSNAVYPGYTTTGTGIVTQPTTVMVTNPVYHEVHPDSTSQIIFSCVVIWCCFCCLGLPAFIIAIMSHSDYNVDSARGKLRVANILNIIGLVIGICIHLFWIILTIIAIASS